MNTENFARDLDWNWQDFLKKHLPNEKISYVIVDKDGLQTTYEVMLTSGKEI